MIVGVIDLLFCMSLVVRLNGIFKVDVLIQTAKNNGLTYVNRKTRLQP